MKSRLTKPILNMMSVLARNTGQSLPEYALAATAISFACVAGMDYIATNVNQLFFTVSAFINAQLQ